jgi:hypothetical protein
MRRICRFACRRPSDAAERVFVIYARDPRAPSLWENGQVGQSGVR